MPDDQLLAEIQLAEVSERAVAQHPEWRRNTLERREWALVTAGRKIAALQARLDLPHADSNETLALIAEHRLTVTPHAGEWRCYGHGEAAFMPTIADAVRTCVSRIRGQQ